MNHCDIIVDSLSKWLLFKRQENAANADDKNMAQSSSCPGPEVPPDLLEDAFGQPVENLSAKSSTSAPSPG